MAQLVVGVLRDVGRHIIVNALQCLHVRPALVGEFRVLLPEIRLQDFHRRQESQDGRSLSVIPCPFSCSFSCPFLLWSATAEATGSNAAPPKAMFFKNAR